MGADTVRGLVLVNGVPGSGKSALAGGLAAELGLPCISKDAVKETLLDTLGWSGREESRRLGAAAGEICWTVARDSPGPVVIDTWLEHAARDITVAGLARAGIDVCVEVWCHADAAIVRDRFSLRRRHSGHYDTEIDERQEAWLLEARPLGIGIVTDVDTTGPVDVAALAERVRPFLA